MKRELLSEYRAAHDGHAEIDFQDDIERRFLAEAIDEVVRLDRTLGNADIEPEIEVNENHQTGATSDAAIPSMSHIPFPQNEFSAGSPSLQRNHAPSKITLSPEFIPVNLEAIAPTEDFGEATLEQMADAGVFGLPNAREMFNRLKRAETFQPGSPKFADPQMPEAAISLPHPEPPCPATPVQTTLAVEDPRLNRSTIGQVEPTGNDQPLVDDAIIPGPSRIAESEHVQAVAQNQDAAKVPDAVPVEDPQPGSSNAGADPRTAGRKARRRRPKKNVPETGFMKKLRALKKKARQPRVENFRAPIVRLRRPNEVYLDFADLADFVADEENLEDDPAEIEDVAVPEPQAVVLRAAGKENIPQNETSINVDDQAQISKRPRLAENYSIPPFGMSSLLPFTPSVTVNTMTLPQVATPAATGFKPSFVSTAHKITPEDYEFERLRNLSQKSLQPNASHEAHNHGSIQNLGLSDIAIPHPGSAVHFAEAPQLESVPKTPVYLRDFMTPAGKVIEFVGADGKLDRHSEFYMEVSSTEFLLVTILLTFRSFSRVSACTFKFAWQ